MALIKVFTQAQNREELFTEIAKSIKLIVAAALNVDSLPTSPANIETVYVEGIDLIGIEYIIEIIAVERPGQQSIADNFIKGINEVYPDKTFSVYFNNIEEVGMANTPRSSTQEQSITMKEAIKRCKQ